MNTRLRRIEAELHSFAVPEFSSTNEGSYDYDKGLWVMLCNVSLPPWVSEPHSHLLFELPESYPASPPDWFYLKRGLRGRGGKKIEHAFNEPFGGRLMTQDDKRWAGYCVHLTDWHVSHDITEGHNLVSAIRVALLRLEAWSM